MEKTGGENRKMPYKDKNNPKNIAQKRAYYLKNKDNPSRKVQRKKANVKYRKKNRIVLNGYQRKRYNADKEKERRQKYKLRASELEKSYCENLTERYMIKHLKKMGWAREEILKNPELIRIQRIIIKTKRLWKQSQTSANLEKV